MGSKIFVIAMSRLFSSGFDVVVVCRRGGTFGRKIVNFQHAVDECRVV